MAERTLSELVNEHAERVRKIVTGQSEIVDLRGHEDAARAAHKAIMRLREQNRDVDEFIIDAAQEIALFDRIGVAKFLWGYPIHVAYEFAGD